MQRDGTPFILGSHPDPADLHLSRVTPDKTPSEQWLQALLDRRPDVLPLRDVDERLDPPAFSLGTEIPTASGPIDNLFICQNGHPVIVETKLWRNPEARRTALAQVIDYAIHLRKWTCDSLETVAKGKGRLTASSLWESVHPSDMDAQEWAERVNDNLRLGRMTLLVVGDHIRPEIEVLGSAVQGHPGFPFRLAVVELKLYSFPDGRYLIVPSTLVRTAEVERAIVRIEMISSGGQTPAISVEAPRSHPDTGGRRVLSEEQFLEQLRRQPHGTHLAAVAGRLLDLVEQPLQVFWGAGSFVIKVPDPAGSGEMVSLFFVQTNGRLYAWPGWSKLRDLWSDDKAVDTIAAAHDKFLTAYGASRGSGGTFILPIGSLDGKERNFITDAVALANLILKTAPRRD